MADEELGIVIEAKSEGERQIRDIKDAFDDLRRSIEETSAVMAAAAPAMVAATTATQALGVASKGTATEAMGLWSALGSIQDALPPMIPVIVAYATLLGIVLAPALMYTAGLAAALALSLGALGGLGALGAAFVGLAGRAEGWFTATQNLTAAQNNLTTAQEQSENAQRALLEGEVALQNTRKPSELQLMHLQDLQEKAADAAAKLTTAQDAVNRATAAADNPWTRFTTHLQSMTDVLGKQAIPMATLLLNWMDSLLPQVQALGSSLMGWFAERLPAVLPMATLMFQEVMDALKRLGAAVTPMFDSLIQHPGRYQRALKEAADGIIAVVQGIIGELDQLASWWARHPELVADAQVTFQLIGNAMDITIRALERIAEDADIALRALGRVAAAKSATGAALRDLPGVGGAIGSLLSAQSGVTIPGPFGAPRLILAHAGEEILPAARSYLGGGGGGNTYTINVTATTASPADVGQQIVRLIQQFERGSGSAWRK